MSQQLRDVGREWGVFTLRRVGSLLPVMILGMLLVVIPANYIGQDYRPCAAGPRADNASSSSIKALQFDDDDDDGRWLSFPAYCAWYLREQLLGCNGLDWYWFLAVLMATTVVNHGPLLLWRRFYYGGEPSAGEGGAEADDMGHPLESAPLEGPVTTAGRGRLAAFATCLLLGASLVALGPFGPVGAPASLVALGIVAPHAGNLLFASWGSRRSWWDPAQSSWRPYRFYLWTPLITLAMAAVVQERYVVGADGAVPGWFVRATPQFVSLLFCSVFYVQGFVDQTTGRDWTAWKTQSPVDAAVQPFLALSIFLLLPATLSTSPENAGYRFGYPLYKADARACVLYVVGSWLMFTLIMRYGEAYVNGVQHPLVYRHATRFSLFLYLTHWLWVEMLAVWILEPLDWDFGSGVALMLPCTAAATIALYSLLVALTARASRWRRT